MASGKVDGMVKWYDHSTSKGTVYLGLLPNGLKIIKALLQCDTGSFSCGQIPEEYRPARGTVLYGLDAGAAPRAIQITDSSGYLTVRGGSNGWITISGVYY